MTYLFLIFIPRGLNKSSQFLHEFHDMFLPQIKKFFYDIYLRDKIFNIFKNFSFLFVFANCNGMELAL